MHVHVCSNVLARFREEQRGVQRNLNLANTRQMMEVQMSALQDTMIRGTEMLEGVDPSMASTIKAFISLNIVPKIQSMQSLINRLEDTGPLLDAAQQDTVTA